MQLWKKIYQEGISNLYKNNKPFLLNWHISDLSPDFLVKVQLKI